MSEGFWVKTRQTLGKVPFTEQAVAAFYCAMDAATPVRARLTLFGALAYFVSPIDLIPDPIPVLGYLDELVLIPLGVLAVRRMIPDHVCDPHGPPGLASPPRKMSMRPMCPAS